MAVLRPFVAIQPNPEKISPADFDWHSLAYPTGEQGERSKFVRYARTTSFLHQHLADATLIKSAPGFLVIETDEAKFLLAVAEPDNSLIPLVQPERRETLERTW